MATTIAARKPILTTAATTPKSPAPKEKQTHTYILMKHRRCYAVRNPPCLHALTLEYNICREHTIRHMCHTQKIFKRRNFKIKLHARSLINEIARCLKKVVNKIVNLEENRNSSDLVCLLPNNIISSILSIDDLEKKHDFNSQPSSSSSLSSMATTIAARKPILTTAATTPKSPAPKEKQTHTYILMKHRRCYAVRNPPCLHALTLEYNICREHTIRHMCHTQKIFKRRNFKIKLYARSLINEIARCLKKVVNKIVNLEEN
ncbi:unnamed protein product, partial [Adineta steineri]